MRKLTPVEVENSADAIPCQRSEYRLLRTNCTPRLKALGWFLLADVFERRGQPDRVGAALRNARMHAASAR